MPTEPQPVSLGPVGDDVNTTFGPGDVATGRGVTYEWEQFMVEVLDRLGTVEESGGGGGGSQGGETVTVSYIHTQNTPAATWTVNHALGTKPVIAVVSTTGDLLLAEIAYPNDVTTVITFGQPYAGTAYLRG